MLTTHLATLSALLRSRGNRSAFICAVCYTGVDSAIRGTISEIHQSMRDNIYWKKTVTEG
jgi:hypothetical protein